MISIIIPYRNREVMRVKRCLESLLFQSYKSFEVVLVDSGSDNGISKEISELTEYYTFCQYVFTDTRGMIWNRSYALNVGARLSIGNILLMADIDLIFEPDFLFKISALNFEKNFYNYRCLYLPEGYNYKNDDWSKLNTKEYKNSGNSRGLLIVSKKDFDQVNGYDEYYQQWGIEDDDIDKRLKLLNLRQYYLSENETISLHQWHKESYTNVPTIWYLQMLNYFEQNEDIKRNKSGFGKIINKINRIDFIKDANQNKMVTVIPKKYLSVTCYNEIVNVFFNCKPNEIIKITYQQPSEFKHTGLIKKIKNFALHHVIKSPHLPNQNVVLEKSFLTTEALFDFMIYFIGINRQHIADYSVDYVFTKTLCIYIMRK